MVRNYIKKGPRHSKETLEKAINEIKTENKSIRVVAAKYGVPKSVLGRLLIKQGEAKRGRKQALNPEDETRLASHLAILAKWGFPLSREDVRCVVRDYVEQHGLQTPFKDKKPGADWFRAFSKRNSLKLKNLESLEQSRRSNTSDPFLIYGFYDLVETKLKELNLTDKPKQIWNLDESGFSHDPKGVKGVAHTTQKVHRTIMGSGKENTTVMACCSADGDLLPPMIIYKGEKLWTSWKAENDIPGTMYAVSRKGYITTEIFHDYFVKFCSTIKERPLLIIYDGHATHLDSTTIEKAIKENISIIKLPSHTTDLLQPLDKCCFKPLKQAWSKRLIEWQRQNQRKLYKSEFTEILCEIWKPAFQPAVVKKGFESTGIYPLNITKYPVERLDPTKLERYRRHLRERELGQNQMSAAAPESFSMPLAQPSSDKDEPPQPGCSFWTSTPTRSRVESVADEVPLDVSASSSFEHLLLEKINKTPAVPKKRKMVDCSAKVITSDEFLNLIKEANAPKPKKTKKGSTYSVDKTKKKRNSKKKNCLKIILIAKNQMPMRNGKVLGVTINSS